MPSSTRSQNRGGINNQDDSPRTFREVGFILRMIQQDMHEMKQTSEKAIGEIQAGQKRIINWVAGMVSSLVVGGILGWLFQK